MKRNLQIYLLLLLVSGKCLSQGSWNPPSAESGFPRTLLTSASIPVVRATLTDPDRFYLYASIWANANAAIPAGNVTIEERAARSMIAREAAFVFLMDRKVEAGNIVPLAQVERDTLQSRVIRLLEQMNTEVDVGLFWTFYTPWQHRSKELISYLIAYDLMKGAGVLQPLLDISKGRLITFSANLYQKSMASYTFLNLRFFTYQFNNHSIMTASALGMAAVVFNDHTSANVNEQPQNWINAGFYNLDNTLWRESGTYPRVSEPDTLAGYAEGPNYFKYGFENAFPFIRAMGVFLPDGVYPATFNGTTRNIPNPWYDMRYDRLYDWLNKIRMPDGGFPSIHDSYMGYGTVIMALSGKPQYNLLNPGFTPDDPTIRSQYLATNIAHGTITDSLFQSLPAAGSLVFRSSWSPDAIYMHMIGKHGIALTGAKSHHQGDASSFSMMAYGELLAVDPGYPGASLAELENKAVDHSLVLVNGAGPLAPTGEFVSTSTNTAYIENSFDTPLADYGEVRVSYQGAEITRKNLFIRNTYFLLSDFVTSSSSKNYTFQLHGNGLLGGTAITPAGVYMPDYVNEQGLYSRNSVSLLARVMATGGASGYAHELDSMVINGGFRRYSKMLVQKNNVTGTIFQSTLYPYTNSPPQIQMAGRSSLTSAVRISAGDDHDLLLCSLNNALRTIPADSSGVGKQVQSNGKLCFLSETTDGQFSLAFLQDGDSIISGSQAIIRTNKKLNVAWMKIDSVISGGWVSGADTVQLFSGQQLDVLQGPIDAISYDSISNMVTVVFTGKGNFQLGRVPLTWNWTGQQDSNWHQAANWQLAGHPAINGLPSASSHVIIPGGAVYMPVIASGSSATCHNLTIGPGAMLTVGLLKQLTIEGSLTIQDN